MERIMYVLATLMGGFAVVRNRWFAEQSMETSRNIFGQDIPEGTRKYKFMIIYGRVITICCGTGMLAGGVLTLAGVVG